MNRRDFVQAAVGSAMISGAPSFALATIGSKSSGVSLLLDASAGTAGKFAFEQVVRALKARHTECEEIDRPEAARYSIVLVAGVAKGSSLVSNLGTELKIELPQQPESLLIHQAAWKGKSLLLVAGADPLGLAYALHDVADRITWTAPEASVLSEVGNISESPSVRNRALSTYCMQQAYFEKRLFSEDYWAKYLDVMVKNRFNTFVFIFGYESSGFLSPSYAWFFDLTQFPEVKAAGVTKERQQRYVIALNRLITMTHERGLQFTLGIWDHIYDGVSSYYTEGVWDHLPMVDGKRPGWPVQGLTPKNLIAYTNAALARFLELVPKIDAVQFRMHGESGLSAVGLKNFWTGVFKVIVEKQPALRIDARVKELPLDIVDAAQKMGLDFRMVTKWDNEQVGPPFFPMRLQRSGQFDTRAGYADLMTYPQHYKMMWQLFTSGTLRILLWGDPEYGRRFANATHIYDGDGFEVAEPLATKMASKPHDMPPLPLMNAKYRYYDEEFERYWPFYFTFGRMGYNPSTPVEVWQKPFNLHYGNAVGPYIQRGLENASGILPRIIGYSLPASKIATTRGWPERQRWGDLPEYTNAEPSDTQLFSSFREDAKLRIDGKATSKIRVEDTGRWFAQRSREVLAAVEQAKRQAGPTTNKELFSALVDLQILAHLAEYHARRVKAGVQYAQFLECQDVSALDGAIAAEHAAIEAWQAIVQVACDVYASDLAMGLAESETSRRPGADLSGTWQDELPKLQAGLQKLEKDRADFHPEYPHTIARYAFNKAFVADGYTFRSLSKVISLEMPNGAYEVRLEVQEDPAKPRDWGPMWIETNGTEHTDTFAVKSGTSVKRNLITEVRQGRMNVMIASESTGQPTLSRMTIVRVDPHIIHVPVRRFVPGEPVVLRATIVGETNDISAQVYWKQASGEYSIRDMRKLNPFVYELTIPSSDCHPAGDYFLVAADGHKRSAIFPVDGSEQPIGITAQIDQQLSVIHAPIVTARANRPLLVKATAKASVGVRCLRVRYRGATQFQNYYSLDMLPTDQPDEYAAEIPGEHIESKFDLMYFFEIFDKDNNGRIFPDEAKETPYIVVKLDRA
jgi:hypothetical protein